jgi:hypothetical protein
MAYGLDAVPVEIPNEGCVVVGMIYGAHPGAPVVAAAGAQGGGMKGPDRLSIVSAETDVHARGGEASARLGGDRELHAEVCHTEGNMVEHCGSPITSNG